MAKVYIYPYKMSSTSATLLASALRTKKVYPDRNFDPRGNKVVINWGSSHIPNWDHGSILNHPRNVAIASNKLSAFQALRDNNILTPPWTTKRCEAKGMLIYGGLLYVRTLLCASGGNGIEVITNRNAEVPSAPLYTGGIKCKREYRVHVFRGNVIDVVAKVKPDGGDTAVDDYIRNHTRGYIFARDSVRIPDEVRQELHDLAVRSVNALALDFGAVDIIRGLDNSLSVLEVNTAPGITGTTLEAYVTAITALSN
jgi:hypothetical protein